MPFKSKAMGRSRPRSNEEWNRETGSKMLPERVKPKAKMKKSY